MLGDEELIALAERHGTPFYAYDLSDVRERIERFGRELPGIEVHYALKANRHPAILRVMREAGFGLDCASVHEARIGLEAGFSADRLLVTQCGFSDADLRWCAANTVTPVLGSLDEVEAYVSLGAEGPVFLRVNGGTGAGGHDKIRTAGPDAKFGVWHDKAGEALARLREAGVSVAGLHQSVGSDVHDAAAYLDALSFLSGLAREHDVPTVDLGGGIGTEQDLSELRQIMERAGGLRVKMEPGRFFVARAGYLVCSVQAVKRNPSRTFCIVDTGMQHLLRPALYGARHPIRALTASAEKAEPMVVAGNACENGDVLSQDGGMATVELAVRRGDLLLIEDVGAYGRTMASAYCGYPLPKELSVGAAPEIAVPVRR